MKMGNIFTDGVGQFALGMVWIRAIASVRYVQDKVNRIGMYKMNEMQIV
jgi:hypothetical protein